MQQSSFESKIDRDGQSYYIRTPAEDHIGKTIERTHNFYESPLLDAVVSFLEPGDLVYDVGANVGNHSVYFAAVAGAQVLSFEPVPEALALLEENRDRNGLQERITIYPVGLADTERSASASFRDHNLGASRLHEDAEGELPLATLDGIAELQNRNPVLMKIDVEGMEEAVIRGARETIARSRPVIVCECALESEFARVSKLLAEMGYAPLDCFNATATYVFVHDSHIEDPVFLQRYLVSGHFSTARELRLVNARIGRQRHEIEALPTHDDLKKLSHQFTAMSRRIDELEQKNRNLQARVTRLRKEVPEGLAALEERIARLENHRIFRTLRKIRRMVRSAR